MITLRKYQQQAVDQIRAAYQQGKRAPLLVLATGGGKTCIFSYVAKGASEKGNRVTILSHRQELVRQICRTLGDFSVPHGIIAANRSPTAHHLTQVASIQTLVRRLDRYPAPDLIVIDEGHHSMANTFTKVIAAYPKARILGCTATPLRLDGRGLGSVFDCIIEGPPVQTLIDEGFLARPVYYAPPTDVDSSKLHIVAGDFNRHETEAMMDKPKITGDAVSHYTRICPGKSALVFCTSLKHCEHVVAQFCESGYRAEMIDGKLDDATRAKRVADLSSGALQVLVSCELLNEGYDSGIVSAGIFLRPTASLALCRQQMGRILRPAPNKPCAYLVDHVGNIFRHGLAEEVVEWSLDPAKKRTKPATDPVFRSRQCPVCYRISAWTLKCPQCGHVFEVKSRDIAQVDGELVELTAEQIASRRAKQQVGMAKDRASLTAIQRARGYRPGWVTMMLQARAKNRIKTYIGEDATIKSMKGEPETGQAVML